MYTIIDYLKFYNKFTLKEVHWNNIDNLMCAILAYLPIESFDGCKNINELYNYANKYKNSLKGTMIIKVYEILDLIYNSKRYKNLKTYNFINIRNDDIQFGAVTFRINNETIISYKGTDGSLIGWIENFRIIYNYPTDTHKLAIKYLNDSVNSITDNNLYIVGHSKGGNLAMVSAMETTEKNFKKIKKICNFDGPGFRRCEFESKKYNGILEKTINVLPTGSVIGILLNNKNYTVVKSNNHAFNEHYPTSWNIFGECFIEGKLSGVSKKIHNSMNSALKMLDNDKLGESFETIFQSLEKKYSSDINLSLEDIIKAYRNARKNNIDAAKYIDVIFNSLIKTIYVKKKD